MLRPSSTVALSLLLWVAACLGGARPGPAGDIAVLTPEDLTGEFRSLARLTVRSAVPRTLEQMIGRAAAAATRLNADALIVDSIRYAAAPAAVEDIHVEFSGDDPSIGVMGTARVSPVGSEEKIVERGVVEIVCRAIVFPGRRRT